LPGIKQFETTGLTLAAIAVPEILIPGDPANILPGN